LSQGQTDCHVNRLTLLKRSTYVRANERSIAQRASSGKRGQERALIIRINGEPAFFEQGSHAFLRANVRRCGFPENGTLRSSDVS
jgi:hypothetical protein